MTHRHSFPLLALLLLPGVVVAQGAPRAVATRITTPPVLDGRLDEAVWREGTPLGTLVQREPAEGRPVSERTEVRILFDDQALYIGAWLYDASGLPPVPGQSLRDASLTDADAFQVILDPFLDRQSGFVFGTTPAGIEYDAQVTGEGGDGAGGRGGGRQQAGSGGGFNLNWDGSWQVATSRDALGWYVEMRIPFATLRYRQGGEQLWGLNVERRIRRKNEQAVWASLPRQFDITRLSLAGTLALEAPVRRILSVSPYLVGTTFRDYRAPSPATDFSPDAGFDAKVGLSQGLTLDVTVNTDFAQAEVDDQQVNLTRFSLFLPEKRGFFLENAGLFAVGASRSAELFFSRRIGLSGGREVPIVAGARLTGRVAGLQVGVLSIQTEELQVPTPVPGEFRQVAPDNNFSVVRASRELGARSSLGAIVVSRVNTGDTGDYNLAWGVDGRLGLGQDLTFDGWLGLTETAARPAVPGGRTGWNEGEYAFGLGSRYITRDWQVIAGYRQVGDHFNPEVGFANRLGYRHVNARVQRHLRLPAVPWFREFRPHVSWTHFWSLAGFSESYVVHIDNHFAFANGAFFQLPGFNLTGEGLQQPFEIRPGIVIPPGTYHNAEWEFRANTNRGAPWSVSGGWELGGFYSGHRFGPTATITYRGGGPLTGSLQASWFDVRLKEGEFTTAVARLNTVYAFSAHLYLQGNFQYNGDTRDLSTNLRFGWVGSAGTGLFVVYNDTEHVGPLERTGLNAGPKQRQLVVKVSRLFDFSR
jgi:hypothetical protein